MVYDEPLTYCRPLDRETASVGRGRGCSDRAAYRSRSRVRARCEWPLAVWRAPDGTTTELAAAFVAVARPNSKMGHVAFETENEVLTARLDRAARSSASEHATGSSAKPHASMPAGRQQGSRRLHRPKRSHRNRNKRRAGTARMSDSSLRSTICRKGFRKPRQSGWCQDAVNAATIARIHRGFSVS